MIASLKRTSALGVTLWLAVIALSAAADARQTALPNLPEVTTLPGDEVAHGGTLALEIDTRHFTLSVSNLQVRFQNRTFPASDHPSKPAGVFFGLVGIPLPSKAGRNILALEWTAAGRRHSKTVAFRTTEGRYRIDKITVDSGQVNLSKKDLARVKKEKQEIQHIYAEGSLVRLWHGRFQLPTGGEVTSPYGNKRMFNNQLRSFHRGVDFRAPAGTSVHAANSGIVRLAKNLFFSGNIAIVDHGTGIFTNYAHLSQLAVTPGQRIKKGQLVGLSGATGRVSGPHLHWGIKVNGVYVNPLQFIEVIASLVEP